MTPEEHEAFKAYVSGKPTILDCAEEIGVSRFTISDVYAKGTGHPTTIKKIRKQLSKAQAA